MSLSRLALRIVTVAALRGRTWAGDAVRDSAIPPLDVAARTERLPFLSVYTDDGETVPRHGDLLSGQPGFALIIEMAVTAQMAPDGAWAIPTTDAGMETTLDLLDRQIRRALMDPDDPWAGLWRALVIDIAVVRTQRGASADQGTRFAGRQIELQVRTLAEPRSGVTASGVWADLLARLEADAALAPLAPVLRAEIEGDTPAMPPVLWPWHWQRDAAEALGHEVDDPRTVGSTIETVVTHPAGYPDT
ncbi:hypothetical protein [Roseospira goensis]|uniref:Uncharacterized protein n=1 Tax=Roseospira goensis TaxID=391922 RepID=A0A7W6WM30_9PROT|nr:hypothetical protein [Roseospira goensis]MBB4287670.1 hypothetical protein [Roseospira goensis]